MPRTRTVLLSTALSHVGEGERIPLAVCLEVVAGIAFELFHQTNTQTHRDAVIPFVNPHTILLDTRGRIQLRAEVHVSWRHLAPENLRGEQFPSSPVFGLGVCAWEAITGERLFHGDDMESISREVRLAPIPPPSRLRPNLNPAVDRLVGAMTNRAMHERPSPGVLFADSRVAAHDCGFAPGSEQTAAFVCHVLEQVNRRETASPGNAR